MRRSLVLILSLFLPPCQVALAAPSTELRGEATERRRAALEAMQPGDLVVVHSGEVLKGPTGGLRADRDFLYLVGMAEENMTLVLERPLAGEPKVILFLRAKDPRREAWDGPRLSPGSRATEITGIADTRPNGELRPFLAEAAARAKRLFHNHDRPARDDPPTGVTAVLAESFEGETEDPRARNTPGRLFRKLRQVKSPLELATLERAIDITCRALSRTIQRLEPGWYEYQAQAMIEMVFRWEGAQGVGFGSIIGSGRNATVLHYVANTKQIEASDLIVMDVGAEFDGYTADVTRTVPANGKFSPRQREIYEIVLRAQQAGFDACRPGNSIRDVHKASYQVINEAGYAPYFTHFTSHWLGLAVHDVGDFNAPLAPGMVLTVEPGIYLGDEALGVRIEDDVLITEDGHRILSDGVPRTVDEIEALMAR